MNAHQSSAGLLVGWVEVEHLTPSARRPQHFQAPSAQSLAMRLDPAGVTIRGEEIACEEIRDLIEAGAFGQRFGSLCLDLLGVDGQLAARPQGDHVTFSADRLLSTQALPRVVDRLAQIGRLWLRPEVRPQGFHHLFPVKSMLWRERQQLDQVGSSPVTPGLSRNSEAVDLDSKAAKEPYRAGSRHRHPHLSAARNVRGTPPFQTPAKTSGGTNMAISTNQQVLVGTDWVGANLGRSGIRLLDVDEDTEAYGRGHIPGALGIHWRNDLQDPIKRDFIGPDAFAALMDRLGIGNDTMVVLYGGNNNWFAAYAYWYFKYYGHAPVRLMDGGPKKWELEKRPVTTDSAAATSTSGYKVGGPAHDIRALRKFVDEKVVGNTAFGLVDVRSPEEYRGELLAPLHLPQEQAQKPGHIPGAKNIPWAKAVNPATGAFLTKDELKALYEGHGITPDREIVAYCRIGERSAHTWFVLHELLSYPRVRNYDGSWTEWGSLVGAPIER